MTRYEFDKKYSFAKSMNEVEIKKLIMFIATLMMDIACSEDNEESKLHEFMDDVKCFFKD